MLGSAGSEGGNSVLGSEGPVKDSAELRDVAGAKTRAA